jgi:hypothetical protein
MPSDVPSTPDEQRIREDAEKRGALEQDRANSVALEQIGNLPENLARALAQYMANPQAAQAESVTCPDGHQNAPGVKFCGECGKSLTPAAGEPQGDAEPPAGDEPDRSSVPLKDRRLDELKAMCAERGLDDQGKRMDLLDRLRAAGSAAV